MAIKAKQLSFFLVEIKSNIHQQQKQQQLQLCDSTIVTDAKAVEEQKKKLKCKAITTSRSLEKPGQGPIKLNS